MTKSISLSALLVVRSVRSKGKPPSTPKGQAHGLHPKTILAQLTLDYGIPGRYFQHMSGTSEKGFCQEQTHCYLPFLWQRRHLASYWHVLKVFTKASASPQTPLVPIHMFLLCASKPWPFLPPLLPQTSGCSSSRASLPSATHPPYNLHLSPYSFLFCPIPLTSPGSLE